jgi:hypothetical protein
MSLVARFEGREADVLFGTDRMASSAPSLKSDQKFVETAVAFDWLALSCYAPTFLFRKRVLH